MGLGEQTCRTFKKLCKESIASYPSFTYSTLLSSILWDSKGNNSVTAFQRLAQHFPKWSERATRETQDTQGLRRRIVRLNLLSSFSSAQGSKFMDTACGSRVVKVMCQLFSAPVHTKVPALASCSFRPRASLRGAEIFFFFCTALESHPSFSTSERGESSLAFSNRSCVTSIANVQ